MSKASDKIDAQAEIDAQAQAEIDAQAEIAALVLNPHSLPDGFILNPIQKASLVAQNTRFYRLRNTVAWAIGAHNQAVLRVVRYDDNGGDFDDNIHSHTAVSLANRHINNSGVQAVTFRRIFRIDMSWGDGAKTVAILGVSDDTRPYLLSNDGNMTIRSSKGEDPDTRASAIQAVHKAHKLAETNFCNDTEFWYTDPAIVTSKQKGFTENPPESAFSDMP